MQMRLLFLRVSSHCPNFRKRSLSQGRGLLPGNHQAARKAGQAEWPAALVGETRQVCERGEGVGGDVDMDVDV